MAILPLHQFSLLVGPSGCGKTTLTLQMWKHHEKGKPFPVMLDPSIKRAAIVLADRTSSEAETRSKYLGIDSLEIYGIVDDTNLDLNVIRDPLKLWGHILRTLKTDPQLIIIDPIALFMEGSLIDYKSVAITLIRFNQYAMKYKTTLLGLHHTAKQRADNKYARPQDRVSGSGAFPGYSSTQCIMVEGLESGNEYDELIIIPHMTPRENYTLMRKEDGYFIWVVENAKNKLLQKLASGEKFMRLQDFKNDAAILGMSDTEIKNWLETEPSLSVDCDFVLLNE